MKDLKELNGWLGDLNKLRRTNKAISKRITKTIDEDGEQGGSGESFEVYRLRRGELDIYVELVINTDSYGYNDFVAGITFVTPEEKVVTTYTDVK